MAIFPYRITMDTAAGEHVMYRYDDQGPEAAGVRARLYAADSGRYGSYSDITVTGIASVCAWFAKCDNISTGAMPHPIIGNVPICDRCRTLATSQADARPGRG